MNSMDQRDADIIRLRARGYDVAMKKGSEKSIILTLTLPDGSTWLPRKFLSIREVNQWLRQLAGA